MSAHHNRVFVDYNNVFFRIIPLQSRYIRFDLIEITDDLPHDVANSLLGERVLKMLSVASALEDEELPTIPLEEEYIRYKEWTKKSMSFHGYKTERTFFKDMERCCIARFRGSLTFYPLRHEKLQAWGQEKGDEKFDIILPFDSAPELIGETLRRAFEICKTMSSGMR